MEQKATRRFFSLDTPEHFVGSEIARRAFKNGAPARLMGARNLSNQLPRKPP